jgi:hypothetical protein
MTTKKVDLQVFCAEDFSVGTHKFDITRPFSLGGYTYYTNAHLAVRVPRESDVPEIEAPPKIEACFVRDFDPLASRRPLKNPVPSAPVIKEMCASCLGSKWAHFCPSCQCKCEGCDGKGWREESPEQSLTIGKRKFGAIYVRRILTLPPPVMWDDNDKGDAIGFTFDGGDGLLMKLRRKLGNHIEVEL